MSEEAPKRIWKWREASGYRQTRSAHGLTIGTHLTWRWYAATAVGWVLALTPWYPKEWVYRQMQAGTYLTVGKERVRMDASREEFQKAAQRAMGL